MTQPGDPRDMEQADETAGPADEDGRSLGDDATVEGGARAEEAEEVDAPGSLGGDNGSA